jgi:geranylgeranyl diphosphate synthase type I
VELLHNATLVHDDVQDGDLTRRGEPTVWARHGVAQAINAGDYLLMLPFLALAELSEQRGELSFQLARAATRVVRGQAEELGLLWSERLDRASWLDAARGKTGALLGLPVLGAALLGGQSESAAEELGELFEELGVLFQLQDDVVDLFGDKGRGAVGCDVKEGKVSALVVLQLERRPESKDELLSILRLPREETTEAHIERVREMFLESGALSGVLELIQSIEARVKGAPALHREPSLSEVARKLLELTLSPIAHLFAPAEQLSEVRA